MICIIVMVRCIIVIVIWIWVNACIYYWNHPERMNWIWPSNLLESTSSTVSPSRGITSTSSPWEELARQADSSKKVSSSLEDCFWGVEKFSCLATYCSSVGEEDSWGFWRRSFLLIVEFQWFLMELSVLPGRSLAICAHLFPYLNGNTVTFCELR